MPVSRARLLGGSGHDGGFGARQPRPGRKWRLMADSWNSVQIVTLVVDALTPITVAGLGVFFARASRRIEQVQWANQTVVTHRLDIFGELAPGLNQLLCFATFGRWKEISPTQAISIKRQLDETMYANRVLFSDELFSAYHRFMTTLFAMYATTEADALLRAPIESQWGNRRNLPWWNDTMNGLFSIDNAASMDDIQAAYDELSRQFRADLYVTHQAQPLLATQS